MHKMLGVNDDSLFKNFDQIQQIYKRRSHRKEFASASYMAYLQFGITCRDPSSVNDLVIYAYRQIYSKLSWLERIYTLDVASKL